MNDLATVWEEILASGIDSIWGQGPGRVLQALQATPEPPSAILAFMDQAISRGPAEATLAACTLGCLGEEHIVAPSDTLPILRPLLSHASVSVRMAATEAIWQMCIVEAASDMQVAAEQESSPTVQEVMLHVARVLTQG